MGFSRQEHWSGLPCPPPGDLPNPEIKPHLFCLLHWQSGSLLLVPPGEPFFHPPAINFSVCAILCEGKGFSACVSYLLENFT